MGSENGKALQRFGARTRTRLRFAGQSGVLTAIIALTLIVVLVGCAGSPGDSPQLLSPTASMVTATPSPSNSGTPDAREALIGAISEDTRHFMGDSEAPVTIIEFGDFQ
jgi:hypothetical protein